MTTMNQILNYSKIILASPVYWYSASAQMKVFIDRTSDFLDIDDIKHVGRRLRGKVGYVVCTSISEEADSSFINSFKDTFTYLGMKYGGHVHANCDGGYVPELYIEDVRRFVTIVNADV
ncbi:flavodoxin family protein [Nitrincola sp. MINF-07-Sa-05]|uniref:flavodoxin family protein n=1 Tax=Nitrincola salilacus TaxID=3400273 RepID=UPI0039185930